MQNGKELIVKVVLLLMAVATVVALFVAYKSIVPPAALQFGNQYVEDAHIRIDSINHLSYSDTVRDGSDMQDVKSRFESDYLTMLRIQNLLDFQFENNLITAEEHDSLMTAATDKFVTVFYCYSTRFYKESEWPLTELKRIREICAFCKLIKARSSSGAILTETASGQLDEIVGVVNDYNAAWCLIGRPSWKGFPDRVFSIEKSRTYMRDPLVNNVDLKNALDAYPQLVGDRYYSYLQGRVNKLEHPQHYDYESTYKDEWNKVSGLISECENYDAGAFGKDLNVGELRDRLNQCRLNADSYFRYR
jgi:hypothetical protein